MSVLNSASGRSVDRGYNYYKNGNLISYVQLSEFEYEGEVQGTNEIPYHVIINTKHPKKSVCDCAFANGNTICKHMVALFFAISPEDLKDYEEWLENDYEKYDEEDYEYDRYGNYNKVKSNFIRPIFFDELIANFIDTLSEDELRSILVNELKRDEEYAFNKYLKKEFQRYCADTKNVHGILDKMNRYFYKLSHDYDYNNKDYTVTLLSNREKEKISRAYNTNEEMKASIDKVILNPEIATYNNYKWIVKLYKSKSTKAEIDAYTKKLESFLDTLKHYSIKNTVPKSNVLITIHLLNDYSLPKTAELLIKNCKYVEYTEYVLENTTDTNTLYEQFNKAVENEKYIHKENIAKIYYHFYLKLSDEEIYNQYLYYDFLYSGNVKNLMALKNTSKFDDYMNKMIKNTKDDIILEKIYAFLDNKEAVLHLLLNERNEFRLMANIAYLKEEYSDAIMQYLKGRFYERVAEEKNRENYRRAAIYIGAIYNLDEGERRVNEIISELKNSKYAKRTALFDEIAQAISKK